MNEIYNAMRASGYQMAYQPIVSKECHQQIGVEALIRRIEPGGKVLLPHDIFNALPSDSSNRELIDYFAAHSAVKYAKNHADLLIVNFNVSMTTFMTPLYVETLKELAMDGLPKSTVLEITESEHIQSSRFIQLSETIQEIKSYGYQVALDDFGCGYSCLRLLRLLNPSIVKYGRNVIIDIISGVAKEDYQALEIMESFSNYLLKKRGIKIIVEGMETASELSIAELLNADYYQGFYFGKPELDATLKSKNIDQRVSFCANSTLSN